MIRRFLRLGQVEGLRDETAHQTEAESKSGGLCKFLKSKSEVEESLALLEREGFIRHPCEPKNWDLANILPNLKAGNLLDMGCWESSILENVALKGNPGKWYGVDLQKPRTMLKNVKYIVGDLTNTRLRSNFFENITCVSVLEHGVDYERFARESARLLKLGGKLFITFDYWNPRVSPRISLYDLPWQPLDERLVRDLLNVCARYGLMPVSHVDWSLGDALIREGYHSPDASMSYTFGLLVFRKVTETKGTRD